MSTNKVPRKKVRDTESYERLELLCYDLCAAHVISTEERERCLKELVTDFEYLFVDDDESLLIYRIFELLPDGLDNEWYEVQMDTENPEEHEERFDEMRSEVPDVLRSLGYEDAAVDVENQYKRWLGEEE